MKQLLAEQFGFDPLDIKGIDPRLREDMLVTSLCDAARAGLALLCDTMWYYVLLEPHAAVKGAWLPQPCAM